VTGRNVVVALLTEDQEFQQMQAADAREAAARLDLEVEVLFAENNAIVQIQQMFHAVHAPEEARPAAIVVEAVAQAGMERVCRNAVKAGIGWVMLNGSMGVIDDLSAEHPDVLISSVLADEVEIGRIQGRQARALLPSGGALLLVQGPPDTPSAEDRTQGLEEVIRETGVEVRSALRGDWTESSAEKAVTSWLRLKSSGVLRPDLIVCQNDSMAVGALRAMRQLRPEWERVPCTGCDGLPAGGRRLVESGELAATVVKPTTTGPALELVSRAIGGQIGAPSIVLAPRSHPPEEELRPRPGEAS
jgi:ABC-type sugar transport system substrate-binding protein